MKNPLRNPIIPAFAGLLGLLLFWFSVESGPDDIVGSLVPELIGFCLEGIFFIGIFSWLQQKKDDDRKRELKQSLAGAIGFTCQLINSSLPPDQRVALASQDSWTRQARTNGTQLKTLHARVIAGELNVSADEIQAMQQLLRARLSTLDSLLSVSAELSHAHLSTYTLILNKFHRMTENEYLDSPELKTSFADLMRLLVSFNTEPL